MYLTLKLLNKYVQQQQQLRVHAVVSINPFEPSMFSSAIPPFSSSEGSARALPFPFPFEPVFDGLATGGAGSVPLSKTRRPTSSKYLSVTMDSCCSACSITTLALAMAA